MRIHLIHGIRTSPDSPVKGLIPYLQSAGFAVKYPEYGFELALETRFFNPMFVGSILPYIEPGDICIGHSNGCALIYEMMRLGAPIQGAVFINGALEQSLVRPAHVKWIDVYYNADDQITEAARIGASIGVVDRDWGQLGHAGYLGNDPEIRSVNCGTTFGLPIVSGHSDFFTPANLAKWAPYLINRIKERLPQPAAA